MKWSEIKRDRYSPGEIVPWWKGYVTDDFCTRYVIVAPLGFNIAFSMALGLWYILKRGLIQHVRFRKRQERLRNDSTDGLSK